MVASEIFNTESWAFAVYVPLDIWVRCRYSASYYHPNAGEHAKESLACSLQNPPLCKVVQSTPLNADYRIVTPVPITQRHPSACNIQTMPLERNKNFKID